VFRVGNKGFENKSDWYVEGDASSASYPLALAAVTGGKVTVNNCGNESIQGDAAFCRILVCVCACVCVCASSKYDDVAAAVGVVIVAAAL